MVRRSAYTHQPPSSGHWVCLRWSRPRHPARARPAARGPQGPLLHRARGAIPAACAIATKGAGHPRVALSADRAARPGTRALDAPASGCHERFGRSGEWNRPGLPPRAVHGGQDGQSLRQGRSQCDDHGVAGPCRPPPRHAGRHRRSTDECHGQGRRVVQTRVEVQIQRHLHHAGKPLTQDPQDPAPSQPEPLPLLSHSYSCHAPTPVSNR